tara:strand:- start:129557 stop:130204 length:648 start_codon:yes stop_codon:yes gene_type:complete
MMKSHEYGPQPFNRLWAFTLSTVIHLGVVGFALSGGVWINGVTSPSTQDKMVIMMADLYSSVSAVQPTDVMEAIYDHQQTTAGSVDKQVDVVGVTVQQDNETPAHSESNLRPAEAIYLQATELTKSPSLQVDIPSDFSLPSSNGVSRVAILRLMINENGDVVQVIVEDAAASEQEQNLLKEAFSKAKFHPGEIDGRAVKSQLMIEVILNEVVNLK